MIQTADIVDDKAIMAQAVQQARREMAGVADIGLLHVYAKLLFKRGKLRAETEPDQATLAAVEEKIRAVQTRARQLTQSPAARPAAPANNGGEASVVRVVSEKEALQFISAVKKKAEEKNMPISVKQISDLLSRRYGITRENIGTPAMAGVRTALLRERELELMDQGEPVSAQDVYQFTERLKKANDHKPLDIMQVLPEATKEFGVTAHNYKSKKFHHLTVVLVQILAGYESVNTKEALDDLEFLFM